MLDFDLALIYGTETRTLKQSVKRNIDRLPKDFMFQLNKTEWQELITISDKLPKAIKFSPALTKFHYQYTDLAEMNSQITSSVSDSIKTMVYFFL